MLDKKTFIDFVINGPDAEDVKTKDEAFGASLPGDFGAFGFTADDKTASSTEDESSFARLLIEASGFGNAEFLERSEVILGTDAVAKHLPERAYYWSKAENRPYQTLLFELDLTGDELLKTTLFRATGKQEILEDVLDRCVQHVLRGFEKGGVKRTASVKGGKQDETLCIVSVKDHRIENNTPSRLVCFATKNISQGSLETFHIKEEVRNWEPQLRDDYLTRLYDRHFSKLTTEKWQDAFISGEERRLTRQLLKTCTEAIPDCNRIAKQTIELLEEVAKSFGLRRKKGQRLIPYDLPKDHEIGIDSESKDGKDNPFRGMTVRDESNRLLGYIIYCLDEKKDADQLRSHLEKNNRFHNVLVIYPDDEEAVMELWQGKTKLEGKLTKQGTKFEGEGKVVNLLSRFFVVSQAQIKNPTELAEELAFRARYLRKLALKQLQDEKKDGELRTLYNSFKKALIHDQTEAEFADSYAQTLTYGLLSARWISKDVFAQKGERFTREKALQYFPTTSAFLKDFFSIVLKATFEFKLTWLLEDVADLLDRTDINSVFEFVEITELGTDPVIHFYEPFLEAYDATLKKDRGVYYTPQSVVSYIVKNVDNLIIEKFKLADGLADVSTWKEIAKLNPNLEIPKTVLPNTSFVQILDPATGTGTFLVEIIDLIYNRMKLKWISLGFDEIQVKNNWIEYVSKYLLPRLYGYEIMMASYVITHMKILLKLNETGYKFSSKDNVNVCLTNALEKFSEFEFEFEIEALSEEARTVNTIKKEKRFTVIVGNPPYSNYGTFNNNIWIQSLLDEYKKDLNEKKLNLNDDYVKFWRLSQWIIERNNNWGGVLGLITPHGWLDALTFRGMRRSIISTFNLIRVLDLHGNTTKKESTPIALLDQVGNDENMFLIKQGVGISICAKEIITESKQKKCSIEWAELWGRKQIKNKKLSSKLNFKELMPKPEMYFLVPFDDNYSNYNEFWSLKEIFDDSGNGIKTERDKITIHFTRDQLIDVINDFKTLPVESIREKYQLFKDSRDWGVERAIADLRENDEERNIKDILYRPFDVRKIFYSGKGKGFIGTPGYQTQRHLLNMGENNIALISTRQQSGNTGFAHVWVSNHLVECCAISNRTREINTIFPLYLAPDENQLEAFNNAEPNISKKFIEEFSKLSGSKYIPAPLNRENDGVNFESTWTPFDLLCYIYGILFDPKYRKNYEDHLKRDFPKIPIPSKKNFFKAQKYRKYGQELINIHVKNNPHKTNDKFIKDAEKRLNISLHNEDGNSIIAPGFPKYDKENCRIMINERNYFNNVPFELWDFNVGGYKPVQKWLKDRKGFEIGSALSSHFTNILAVLSETIRIMKLIEDDQNP